MLWYDWLNLVCELRSACARSRTFLWMSLCLAGFSTRKDLLGVTSIVRAQAHPRLVRSGLPVRPRPPSRQPQARPRRRRHQDPQGRTQDARSQKLHQKSDSNTKPEYIFGPSCQAVAVLTQALSSVFALPLACRIHEGTVFSNRDHRTLLDKMI